MKACSETTDTSYLKTLFTWKIAIMHSDVGDFRPTSYINRILIGNEIVDHSDVVEACTASSFPT